MLALPGARVSCKCEVHGGLVSWWYGLGFLCSRFQSGTFGRVGLRGVSLGLLKLLCIMVINAEAKCGFSALRTGLCRTINLRRQIPIL